MKPRAVVVLSPGHVGGSEARGGPEGARQKSLAPYKYPRWFEWRASLPKNDRGKVARKELKQAPPGR
ncbi:MAG: hypothetical protein IPK67_03365 [Planctomycetes bacterium]|nr:hypothetical protein [Planctomycetota bacterium]